MPEVDTYKSLMPKGLLVASVEIGSNRVFIVAHTGSEACTGPMDMRHCGSTAAIRDCSLANHTSTAMKMKAIARVVAFLRCRRLDRLPYLP